MPARSPAKAPSAWFRGPVPPVLVAILLLGAAVRFLYWSEASRLSLFQVPTGDAATNVFLADRLAHDGLLAPHGEPYERAPLYPFFLWGLRALGVGLGGVRGIQFLMGLAGVVFLWILGRRAGGRAGAVTAALGGALYAPFVFFESDLLSISLGIFLLEIALLVWGKKRWALAAGLLVGGAALAQPNFFLAGAIAAGASLLWPTRLGWPDRRGAVLLAVGLVLPPLATFTRNLAECGEPIPISVNGGINFYIGNNPSANGTFVLPPDSGLLNRAEGLFTSARETAEKEAGRPLSRRAVDRYWWLRGLDFWLVHPGRALALTGVKTLLALNQAEVPSHYDFVFFRSRIPILWFLPTMGWLLPLGGIGLVLLWRRGERTWGILALALLVAVVPFFITGRYRLPLAVLLWPAAGLTVERILAQWRRPRRLVGVGAGAAAFLVVALLPIYQGGCALAHMLNVEGAALVAKGDLEGAKRTLERALEANPEHAEALNNLAYVHELQGDMTAALSTYRRAIAADPTQAETYLNIEELYRKAGRPREAMEILDRMEAARGGRIADVAGTVAYRRGANSLSLGDTATALSQFEEAVDKDPKQANAWLTLSLLDRKLGREEEALTAAQSAVSLAPDSPEALVNLGRCQEDAGHDAEAIEAYRAADTRGGGSPELYERLGTLLVRVGRNDDAERVFLKANQGRPHPPSLFALALLYEKEKRWSDARLAFEALVKLKAPQAAEARAHLAKLPAQGGRAGR
jgi:tetratricopeptide (TPR) repeat protein